MPWERHEPNFLIFFNEVLLNINTHGPTILKYYIPITEERGILSSKISSAALYDVIIIFKMVTTQKENLIAPLEYEPGYYDVTVLRDSHDATGT